MNKSLTYLFAFLLLVLASGCGGDPKADLLGGDETINEDTSTDEPEGGPEGGGPGGGEDEDEDEDGDEEEQESADAIDSSEAIDGEIVADNSSNNTNNTDNSDNNINTDDNNDTSADDTDDSINPDSSDDADSSDDDSSGDTADSDENNDYDLIQKTTVDISSYNYFEKKMTFGTYDAYYLPDSTFRVVCEQPCGIPEDLLKKKLLGAKVAVEELVALLGADTMPKNQPVDIHLTSSAECGDYDTILAAKGYVSRFFGIRFNGTSYMCLWEYDDDKLVLPLNDENVMKIEAQQVLVHEYSHIVFDGRVDVFPSNFEDFVKAFSFYVSGYWDGNGLEPENFIKITDACHLIISIYAEDVYNLCTNCGFSFDDVSTLMHKIDEEYELNGLVSKEDLKVIFDSITGTDTASQCGLDWLN